jgi:nitric oxide reductase NorE protein
MTESTSTSAVISDGRPIAEGESAHLPGDGHMWVMVLGDMVIFGSYFLIYMVDRTIHRGAFLAAQQHLSITIGVINTMILLTSSLLVARSAYAARSGRCDQAIKLTYAAGTLGVLFIAIKAYEWSAELGKGLTVSNEFFSYYYVLTGVHMLHVTMGLIILGVNVRELRAPKRRRITLVEQGATYWHMVDLLWIAIFGLLYVVR